MADEPTAVAVAPEVAAELARGAADYSAKLELIAIVDEATFQAAVEDRAEIKRRIARIDDTFDPIVDAAHKTWKAALGQRTKLRDPYEKAEKAYARAMGAYEREQERLRREAEEAAARVRREAEAAERRRVSEEEAAARKRAEDDRIAAASELEKKGDAEGANRLLDEPVKVAPVTPRAVFVPVAPMPAAPAAAGVSFRDNWKAVVTDLLELIRAVAGYKCGKCGHEQAGSQPITLVQANMVVLNGSARMMKRAFNVPGVRADSERVAAQRLTE